MLTVLETHSDCFPLSRDNAHSFHKRCFEQLHTVFVIQLHFQHRKENISFNSDWLECKIKN